MTDDIAACPHSLAERETAVADGMCPICSADALSRRSTPPLPDEIAGLIERVELSPHNDCVPQSLADEVATPLHALAQENERWKAIHRTSDVMHLEKTEFMLNQEERIRELETENDTLRNSVDAVRARYLQGVFDEKARADKLEAERDEAKADYLRRHKDVGDQMDRRIKAEAERDAIRAKTFEECLAEIIAAPDREEAIENIRALAQTDEVTSLQDADPELQDAVIALAQTDEGKTETGE